MLGLPHNAVRLVNHDDTWDIDFHKAKELFLNLFGNKIIDIQHVGSTAINGIKAKPVLDVAVVFKAITASVFDAMRENQYEYYGEVANGKHLFILRGEGNFLLQHIHCYEESNLESFVEQINFRDFIRSHSEYAIEYESIKQELCMKYPNDRKQYTAGKQAFFDKIKHLADKTCIE